MVVARWEREGWARGEVLNEVKFFCGMRGAMACNKGVGRRGQIWFTERLRQLWYIEDHRRAKSKLEIEGKKERPYPVVLDAVLIPA